MVGTGAACLQVEGYTLPARVTEVRERRRRVGASEPAAGGHEEHLERRDGVRAKPPQQRMCLHCAQRGRPGLAEGTLHIIYDCALYDNLRPLFPELFPAGQTPGERPTLGEFIALPSAPLAEFAGAARRRASSARGLPP